MTVEVGQRWKDLDCRSNYDVDPQGAMPDVDYVGPVWYAPRVVVIEAVDATHASVRTEHSGRRSRIRLASFGSRGRRGDRGFELLP